MALWWAAHFLGSAQGFEPNPYILRGVKCCWRRGTHREDQLVTRSSGVRAKRHGQVHDQITRGNFSDLRPRRTLRYLLCVAGTQGGAGQVTRRLVSHFNSFTKILSTSRRSLVAIRNINPTATQVLRLVPSIYQCCARYHANEGNYLGAARRLTRRLVNLFTKTTRRHTLLLTLSDHDQIQTAL